MAETLTEPTASSSQIDAADPAAESSTLETLVGAWDKPAADPLPEGDKAPDKAEPKTEPKAEPKPDPKPEVKTDKPDGKPAPKLFQAHEALKKTVKTIEAERDQLKTRLAELEARKPEGPDTKEYESLKSERERLAAELRESAFERSDEYRKQFVEARNTLYKEAVADIASLTVTTRRHNSETGEEMIDERPATEADFRRIYFLPPREQDKAIAEMFGPSQARVHRHLDELARNDRESRVALQRAREDSEGRSKKMQEQSKQMQETYEKSVKASHQELQTKWPHLFKLPDVDGDKADKELAEAHQSGLDLVASFKSQAGKLSVEDAAAHSAVIEARAGWFPRGQIELRRANEKIKALEARLKGREASDPGAGGDSKPAGGATDEADNIEGMAKVWDKR